MAGSNSILFDIDSIVDMEWTALRYLASEYDTPDSFVDINLFRSFDDERIKMIRTGGYLFKMMIKDKTLESQHKEILSAIINRDQKEIFSSDAPKLTDTYILLTAYQKVGFGIIKCTVRCDNEFQRQFISKINRDVQVIVQPRREVDTSKYGRIIIGNCDNASDYELNEPKSLLVLDFLENFEDIEKSQLSMSFILLFGDIHSITITQAYRMNKIEG